MISKLATIAAAPTRVHVTGWGWFWLAWMILPVVVELYWLVANTANTLSRQIWGIEGVDLAHPFDFAEWPWEHYVIGSLLVVFLGWLMVHLVGGIWR